MSELKALLVFPKRSECLALKSLLLQLGFRQVDMSGSGEGAWLLLANEKYDLIITDRDLPGKVTGMNLVRRVNGDKVLFITPIIMVTSENRRDKIIEAVYAGVGGYILRPYTLKIIENKIQSILITRGAFNSQMNKIELGRQLLEKGEYGEAIETFERLIEEEPNAEGLYSEGYQHMSEGRYDNAIAAFRQAIEINHLYAEAYRGLGEAYMKLGNLEEAERYLVQAGQLFIQKSQFDEAREAILSALKVNPDSVNPYNTMGILYRKAGDFPRAIKYYEMALKLNPVDEKIYYNLAHVFMETLQREKAISLLQKALELAPHFDDALRFMRHIESGGKSGKNAVETILEGRYVAKSESKQGVCAIMQAVDRDTGRDVRILLYSIPEESAHLIDQKKAQAAWKKIKKLATLNHPNVRLLYDVAQDGAVYCLIQEWLEGQYVHDLMAKTKLIAPRMALEIALGVSEALGYMHKKFITHQSLRPSDVIITEDKMIRVSGFLQYEFENILMTGEGEGSFAMNPYLSPEHFSNKSITPASDVFSLGSILYELLVRKHPFSANSPSSVIHNICFSEPESFHHPDDKLTSTVQNLFSRALAKDPEQRYQSGDEMTAAITDALDCLDRSWRGSPQFLRRT